MTPRNHPDVELSERAASVLAEGRQAYLAVDSAGGPHVTPELYAWSDGRLWMAVAATTLKARVLRRRAAAAALVGVRDRTVAMQGRVDVIDPRRPQDWLRAVGSLPRTARALTRFATRNVDDLVAFGGDLVKGRLGLGLPASRVLLRFTPSAAALVEGDAVVERFGHWETTSAPAGATAIGAAGSPVVIGLPGPVALPGRWCPDADEVHVLPALLALASPGRRLGVVHDDYVAPGPAAKRGILHRGTGRVQTRAGVVRVKFDRAVEWNGVSTVASQPA